MGHICISVHLPIQLKYDYAHQPSSLFSHHYYHTCVLHYCSPSIIMVACSRGAHSVASCVCNPFPRRYNYYFRFEYRMARNFGGEFILADWQF